MKRFLLAAALAVSTSPVNAATNFTPQEERVLSLIKTGNGAMSTALYVLKTTSSFPASCIHVGRAVDAYTSAYVLYPSPTVLELVQKSEELARKYC